MTPTEIAHAVLTAWEERDPTRMASLLAADFVLTGPAPVPLNKQAFLVFQQVHNDAFADWQFNPHGEEEADGRVRLGVQITATHTGPYDVSKLGVPIPAVSATGKRRQWPQEILTFRVQNGEIAALHVDTTSDGGVLGTLAWLGIDLPSPSTPTLHTIGARWAEIWNADRSLAVIDEIVAANFVSHSAPPGLPPGREGVKMWASAFRSAFPDLWSKVEDVIMEGDRVVERFRGGGTHQGELFGIPATGVTMETTGINILRIVDGKVVEHWGNSDDLGVMRQLGVLP
jgi:predicted ester cyclase